MVGRALTMVLAFLGPEGGPGGPASPPADLVVRDAVIHTAAAGQPCATAMAVRGGRIVRVGDESAVAPLVGPDTRVLDLRGGIVLPGLVDGHMHTSSSRGWPGIRGASMSAAAGGVSAAGSGPSTGPVDGPRGRRVQAAITRCPGSR